MTDWNPSLYLRFEDERTRPARDLLNRVPLVSVSHAVDLGCGPGNSTELLAQRWGAADLLGIDTSEAMLVDARRRMPSVRFEKADAQTWHTSAAPDLIFANAVLQWVPGHAALMQALLRQTAPGGVVAVQMPDNLDQPSHRLMRETAMDSRWEHRFSDNAAMRIREPILSGEEYYNLFVGEAALVDIWRTTYFHVLDDAPAIVAWVNATGLRPFLDALAPDEREGFVSDYTSRIAEAYKPRADGKVVLAFPRIFIIAQRQQ